MNKKIVTWHEARELVIRLVKIIKHHFTNIHYVYGIPRGGTFVALLFSEIAEIPMTSILTNDTLVIDDIVDSGSTITPYINKGCLVASLHYKSHSKVKPHFFVETTDNWIVYPWEEASENETIENNIRRIIELLGEDPNREGLKDTPKRVAKAYGEWFGGYDIDPTSILQPVFIEKGYDEMICLCNIESISHCEHHLAKIDIKAHIAYIPKDGRVVGISKLARLVDCFAHRLQIQERLTQQIVDAIECYLRPLGCMCVIEAKHGCISTRGVKKQNSTMVTSAVTGVFKDVTKGARQEFLNLIKNG